MNKIAQLGILGAVVVGVVATFLFVAVTAVLDIPGVRELPGDVSTQVFGVLTTGVAAIIGAAAATFGGKSGGGE